MLNDPLLNLNLNLNSKSKDFTGELSASARNIDSGEKIDVGLFISNPEVANVKNLDKDDQLSCDESASR